MDAWGSEVYLHMRGDKDPDAIDLYAAPQPAVPQGYKLVPIEPTPEMVNAPSTIIQAYGAKLIYQRMLAAAPPAGQEDEGIEQPTKEPVVFGMRGEKMTFAVGVQSFTLDYMPDEPGEFEFMALALTQAIARASGTSCNQLSPLPSKNELLNAVSRAINDYYLLTGEQPPADALQNYTKSFENVEHMIDLLYAAR
jgi:hypothetical protein